MGNDDKQAEQAADSQEVEDLDLDAEQATAVAGGFQDVDEG